jgi:hypothetical protein
MPSSSTGGASASAVRERRPAQTADAAAPVKAAPAARAQSEETIAPYADFLPWAVLLVALVTRYWGLTDPAGVVFDEVRVPRVARSRTDARGANCNNPYSPHAVPLWALREPVLRGHVPL